VPAKKQTATITKTQPARKKSAVKKKRAPARKTANRPRAKTAASKKPSTPTLTLDSVAVINNAKALYEELGKVIDTDVNIDASAVEMIDTAILQLLYVFVTKVTSNNHKINWINPSDEFISRARLIGLSRNLGIA
jgi:anti-anti-sigma regulatory factor